jgi:transposase
MNKSDAIRLRKLVQKYAAQGMPSAQIARRLGVSRPFVHKWKDVDHTEEKKRGWKKGKRRTYTDTQEEKVVETRKKAEKGFFSDRNSSGKN